VALAVRVAGGSHVSVGKLSVGMSVALGVPGSGGIGVSVRIWVLVGGMNSVGTACVGRGVTVDVAEGGGGGNWVGVLEGASVGVAVNRGSQVEVGACVGEG